MNKSANPSRQVLAVMPAKVLTFLNGVSSSLVARTALTRCGYTSEDNEQGWNLLRAAVRTPALPSAPVAAERPAELVAIDEIEAFASGPMRRAQAALQHLYPEAGALVFAGIELGRGFAAVLAVETFLDRVAELHQKPRKLLAARGITDLVVKHLRERIRTSKVVSVPEEPHEDPNGAEREAALRALRAWYDDWSEAARTAIDDRSALIRLGLAKRRASKKPVKGASDPSGPKPTPVTTPVTTAAE
jgi:hypothetical protein